jgi:hypothetical protein
MVRMIQEHITQLIKWLIGQKQKETKAIYIPVWFPATKNKKDFD